MHRKNLIVALLFVVLSGILITGCSHVSTQNANTAGTEQPAAISATIIVDDGTGAPKTYPVQNLTDATAFGALKAASQSNGFDLQYDPPGQYGVFVKGIVGKTGNDKTFWIYSVNGQEGQVAADQMQLQAEDTVTWKYTTSSAN